MTSAGLCTVCLGSALNIGGSAVAEGSREKTVSAVTRMDSATAGKKNCLLFFQGDITRNEVLQDPFFVVTRTKCGSYSTPPHLAWLCLNEG